MKCDNDKLEKLTPNVVVGNGVITGVGVIVIYGGDCALTTPTMSSAHIIEIIFESWFLKLSIKLYNIGMS
ncbi:MAG: hypothetical protein WC932_02690 [archaeon]